MTQRAAVADAHEGRDVRGVVDTETETFWSTAGGIERRIRRRDGTVSRSGIGSGSRRLKPGKRIGPERAEQLFLRSKVAPAHAVDGKCVTAVDLFSGCGGITLGLKEACRALGRDFQVALALDSDPVAIDVFARNFPDANVVVGDVTDRFDREVGDSLSDSERSLANQIGPVDILVGGPPCQGHSDFNNRTRRRDKKNELYLRMVRAAEVFQPTHILVENVPGALKDRNHVVQRSMTALRELGYSVNSAVIDTSLIGVPQRRRRLLVVASLERVVDIDVMTTAHARQPRSVKWALGDLVDHPSNSLLDEPANSAPATRQRIAHLFDHDLFDLPDTQRPPCHAGGNHTYGSIYGRLRWEESAQTVTTGFYSMCMGRYVHPSRRRTLTAHEAARLQFFPDFFDFTPVRQRGDLARLIGNAVPMKLSYLPALELLR